MHEPAQVKFANASDYAVPSLTFSYNAGGSQQSTSSSVINSNPSASPVAFQPPITRWHPLIDGTVYLNNPSIVLDRYYLFNSSEIGKKPRYCAISTAYHMLMTSHIVCYILHLLVGAPRFYVMFCHRLHCLIIRPICILKLKEVSI
ncbi:uncharacterized protein LOC116125932 isoform X1 [Pistacia vera]|uniref:uncharacterized protein LOC116125932 isoform X1 n=1 Tax=Pistacia vera TaxID=55513 RepID=UPI001262F1E9|nr:uncharacterized protein LOC116125932 isoform X1 [Pistacia vera]